MTGSADTDCDTLPPSDCESGLPRPEVDVLAKMEQLNRSNEEDARSVTSRKSGSSGSPKTRESTPPEEEEEDLWTIWGEVIRNWENEVKKRPQYIKALVKRGIPQHFRTIAWQLLSNASVSSIHDVYSDYMRQNSVYEKVYTGRGSVCCISATYGKLSSPRIVQTNYDRPGIVHVPTRMSCPGTSKMATTRSVIWNNNLTKVLISREWNLFSAWHCRFCSRRVLICFDWIWKACLKLEKDYLAKRTKEQEEAVELRVSEKVYVMPLYHLLYLQGYKYPFFTVIFGLNDITS
uniref:Rab-GAP TBC domain-containing protein n=1 Tax=Heterorhabditis bacteriophora TaxID=37862 RepID=A0A1I7XD47_HETBA